MTIDRRDVPKLAGVSLAVAPNAAVRETFTPGPSGFRFHRTAVHASSDLGLGQYSCLGGPVSIEPKDNPAMTLFHCHQQLHMDFGFMALLDYEKAA